MITQRKGIVFYIFLAFQILAYGSSVHGTVIFQDDFESGDFEPGWAQVSSRMVVTSDRPCHGDHSARGYYTHIENNNQMMMGLAEEEIYIRFYILYEEGFLFPRLLNLMRLGSWAPTEWWYLNLGLVENNSELTARAVNSSNPVEYLYHQSTPVAPGTWRCIEYRVKLNTPGLADGVLQGWIDGKPAFSRTGVDFRGSLTRPINYLWIVGNYSDSQIGAPGDPIPGAPYYVWLDDVVLSDEYIGPVESTLPPEPTPGQPQGDIIWSDGFESGDTSRWSEDHETVITTAPENVHSGDYAAEFNYMSSVGCNGWLWRTDLPTDGLDCIYISWYQKWRAGWAGRPLDGRKILMVYGLNPPNESGSGSDWRMYFEQMKFYRRETSALYGVPDSWKPLLQNGTILDTIWEGNWEHIEIMVQPNTPGSNDGAVALWIDGNLVNERNNVVIRYTDIPLNALMVNSWYAGGTVQQQKTWVDDFAVSTLRTDDLNAVMLNCWYAVGTPVVQTTWVDDFAVSTSRLGPYHTYVVQEPVSSVDDGTWMDYE